MTAPHRRRTRRDERTGADPDVVREIFDAARLSREPDPRTPPGPGTTELAARLLRT